VIERLARAPRICPRRVHLASVCRVVE
jgi:hypothetical protein